MNYEGIELQFRGKKYFQEKKIAFVIFFWLPSVEFVGLAETIVSEDLDVVEHDFDDFLRLLELPFDLVAVVLGVFGVQLVDPLGLVLDPSFDVVQLGIGDLSLLADLLGQPLELFQPGNLVLDDLVALLVQHHQLIPVSVQSFGHEIAVEGFSGVLEEAFDVSEGVGDALLLVEPGRNVFGPEPLGFLGDAAHFAQSVWEIAVLHESDVFLDPLMQRARQLPELLEAFLAFSVEERMAWRWLREDVVELRDVGDDGLFVRFRSVHI